MRIPTKIYLVSFVLISLLIFSIGSAQAGCDNTCPNCPLVPGQVSKCAGNCNTCSGQGYCGSERITIECGSQCCVDGEICMNCGCRLPSESCCTPNCIGKACGDDGCGGSCGPCPNGEACSAGQCTASLAAGIKDNGLTLLIGGGIVVLIFLFFGIAILLYKLLNKKN